MGINSKTLIGFGFGTKIYAPHTLARASGLTVIFPDYRSGFCDKREAISSPISDLCPYLHHFSSSLTFFKALPRDISGFEQAFYELGEKLAIGVCASRTS